MVGDVLADLVGDVLADLVGDGVDDVPADVVGDCGVPDPLVPGSLVPVSDASSPGVAEVLDASDGFGSLAAEDDSVARSEAWPGRPGMWGRSAEPASANPPVASATTAPVATTARTAARAPRRGAGTTKVPPPGDGTVAVRWKVAAVESSRPSSPGWAGPPAAASTVPSALPCPAGSSSSRSASRRDKWR